MKQGRRWVVVDADYFTNDFTEQLGARFGWAGIGTFVALLCAAKKNYPQGQISYTTELEARHLLGIIDRPLVNDQGEEWTLEEFFRFTGLRRMTRQPRRHLAGRRRHLEICRWDLWQTAAERLRDLEQKRTSRSTAKRDTAGTLSETGSDNVPLEKEKDQEKEFSPLSPPKGATTEAAQRNGNGQVTADITTAVARLKASKPPPATKRPSS